MAANAPQQQRRKRSQAQTLADADVRVWQVPIKGTSETAEFYQDELTFYERNRVFAIGVGALSEAISSGSFSIAAVADAFDKLDAVRSGEASVADLAGAKDLIAMVLRIVSGVPDALERMMLDILSVPLERRARAQAILAAGLDDDTGFGIIETFLKQNQQSMLDFTRRWLAIVRGQVEAYKADTETSAPSTDSSSSAHGAAAR